MIGTPGTAEVLTGGAIVLAAVGLLGWLLASALGPARTRAVWLGTAAVGLAVCVAAGLAAAAAPPVGSAPVAIATPESSAPSTPGPTFTPTPTVPTVAPTPPDAAQPDTPPADADAPPATAPSLDEGRRQFALLASLARETAGPTARWSDAGGPLVVESPCAFGTRLTIDAEYTMGVITDTSSDEHDRAVIDDNVAMAEAIGRAWRTAGLGRGEMIHGEQYFGAGAFTAVDQAMIAYDFGVAQPRVSSHCLAAG